MRPRKKSPELPRYVHRHHGAYYLVRDGKWRKLASDLPSALAAYAQLFDVPSGGLDGPLESAYATLKSEKTLAKNTIAQYDIALGKLKYMLARFDSPAKITMHHVYQLRSELAKTPNMANRVLTLLREIGGVWCREGLIDNNPAVGVPRLKEKKRDRLITPEEYRAIYVQAGERLQIIMDLLYLTGQRVNDVLRIRLADIKDEGIYFQQAKTRAKLIVRWTPELRAAHRRAINYQGPVKTLTLLVSRYRKAPDYRSVNDQWRIACKTAGVPNAQMRDLRAMSGTAAKKQGKDPQKLLGHTTDAMTVRYLRDKEVPEVEGPSFSHPAKSRRRPLK